MMLAFHLIAGPGVLPWRDCLDVIRRVNRLLRGVLPIEKIELYNATGLEDIGELQNPWHRPGVTRQKYLELYRPVVGPAEHLLHAPIISGDYKFFGGAAGCICCDGVRVSASTCFDNRAQSGLSRRDMIWTNAAVAAHEILHVWGAEHHRLKPGSGLKLSIMDPALAMWNAHRNVVISNLTKRQVKKCLKKHGMS